MSGIRIGRSYLKYALSVKARTGIRQGKGNSVRKPALCHPHKPVFGRGLCDNCYHRQWRLGKPELWKAIIARYHATHKEEEHVYRLKHYSQNREREMANSLKWNKEHPEKHKAHNKKWRQEHPEEVKARNARWYTEHREEEIARVSEERKLRPRYWYGYVMNRRARKKAALVAPVSLVAIYERDNGRCQICNRKVAFSVASLDHTLPLSKGGTHEARNVRLAHTLCNIRRQDKGSAQLRLLA